MPSNLDYDAHFRQPPEGESVYEKIERCEKNLRVIRRAVLMRIALTALLLYIPFAAGSGRGVFVMMFLVGAINLSGLLPLVSQWKIKKKELDRLLDEEE